MLDYWGPDLAQKAIADVARSSSIGTWCYDIQRAGHFSALSAAQGQFSIEDRDSNTPHIKKVRVVSTLTYYLSD